MPDITGYVITCEAELAREETIELAVNRSVEMCGRHTADSYIYRQSDAGMLAFVQSAIHVQCGPVIRPTTDDEQEALLRSMERYVDNIAEVIPHSQDWILDALARRRSRKPSGSNSPRPTWILQDDKADVQ